jgi:hypothetical protein
MPLPRTLLCSCGALLLLSACNAPPGLEAGAVLPPSNQPVELLPLGELLAQADSGVANDASAAALAARAAQLRARVGAN